MNKFLEQIYQLAKKNNEGSEEDAIDLIYNHIDELLLDGKFDDVNLILENVKFKELPIVLSLAFLTITNMAKDVLVYRKKYYNDLEKYYKEINPENVKELLAGLK